MAKMRRRDDVKFYYASGVLGQRTRPEMLLLNASKTRSTNNLGSFKKISINVGYFKVEKRKKKRKRKKM